MNLSLFLSKRLVRQRGSRFSGFMVRLSVLAIALSVSVMLLATSLIQGFQQEIQAKMYGLWGHIYITHAGVFNMLEARPIHRDQPFIKRIDNLSHISYKMERNRWGFDESYGVVESKGGIRNIHPYVSKPGVIQANDEMEGIVVKGVSPDFDWEYLADALKEGQLPTLTDTAPSRDLLISQITANRMRLQVGDKLRVVFVEQGKQLPRVFRVCGLYRTGLEDYDAKFAIGDMRILQTVYGWDDDQVAGFEVLTQDPSDIELYNEYILYELLPAELYAGSVRERYPAIFDWLELQNTNKAVILLLMIIVSIVNMSTALLILILERIHMIGVLKALGSHNWTIQKVFLYHATYIVMWGLLLGNVIGLGLMWLQDTFHWVKLSEENYYLEYAPIDWNLTTILLINVGTLVITLLCLLLPSLAVMRVRPLRALRLQ